MNLDSFLLNWRFSFEWGDSYILIILVVFAVIVFVGVKMGARRDQQVAESFQKFAETQNLSFSAGVSQGSAKFVADFGVGSLYDVNGQVRNVFWAEYNHVLRFRAFEYMITVPTKHGSTTLRISVAQLGLPIQLPDLQVRQEDIFSRIGTKFGKQDIVVGDKGFDRMFRIRGVDEDAIRTFLNEDVRAWLMLDVDRGFETKGYQMMIFKGGELNEKFVAESRKSLLELWDLLPENTKQGGMQ